MYTRSRIIAGASGLAGEPADEPLPGGVPHWLRYELIADIETELLRDVTLSAQNRMMEKTTMHLQPDQREFNLSRPGLEDPVYISLSRPDLIDVVPLPIEISNIVSIDQDARDGRRTIAFYSDRPQTGITSWLPDGTETLTIWYDRSPETDPSVDQSTMGITSSYVPLVKAILAGQMLELMKQPIGEMLKGRITRGLQQWDKFVRNGKQQGLVKKSTYRPERFQLGNAWEAWPGRVPFE